ncbi:F0F1 ATP synthase subunit A [Sinanaerobacter sp. ZZT-01]|uniref:F0F1 ATP synthase subunit A n=1 Tax=Sinanaerobacter sp. ZZT-01 TaxID=3111540 RepID=UPI002D772F87|nr:F0F1 ATP synthase subunit A [Sinanaerobacter sp. ZZT-01]WRR92276.1 F0F1 ATP synthase subunit A [Sinanaerobacter sp. ZZT-01]
MDTLSEELIRRLNTEVCFEIPIFGGIPIYQSVVATWGIMAFLVVGSVFLVRNLSVVPGKKQLALEIVVGGFLKMFSETLGETGKQYAPYLTTVLLYLGIANLTGVIDVAPPTKDLNVTAALALISIVLVEYAGIRARGIKGWAKSFAEPMPIIAPIKIMEVFMRPLSLCMRMFGNILGSFVVMELLMLVVPVIIPVPFSLYFDFFDGLVQAYVFVFLTSLFIREAVEKEE